MTRLVDCHGIWICSSDKYEMNSMIKDQQGDAVLMRWGGITRIYIASTLKATAEEGGYVVGMRGHEGTGSTASLRKGTGPNRIGSRVGDYKWRASCLYMRGSFCGVKLYSLLQQRCRFGDGRVQPWRIEKRWRSDGPMTQRGMPIGTPHLTGRTVWTRRIGELISRLAEFNSAKMNEKHSWMAMMISCVMPTGRSVGDIFF